MYIKSPLLAIIGLVALLVATYLIIDTIVFLSHSKETQAAVKSITGYNSKCGGGKRRRSYPCTKYDAVVKFYTEKNVPMEVSFGAGSARGTDQSTSLASYRIGESLMILYDTTNPARARLNTFFGIWGACAGATLIGVLFLIFSLFQPRRSNFRYTI